MSASLSVYQLVYSQVDYLATYLRPTYLCTYTMCNVHCAINDFDKIRFILFKTQYTLTQLVGYGIKLDVSQYGLAYSCYYMGLTPEIVRKLLTIE